MVDQHDEFAFYEEQKNSSVKTSVIAKEKIPISPERRSREAQADQIIEEDAPIASVRKQKKLQR